MLRAKHMGFRSVKLVEVKAETTTPGEVRTTTDATGARVSTSRGRRTLPKLEFSVDEDGAILHGPQRSALPLAGTSFAAATSTSPAAAAAGAIPDFVDPRDAVYQSASFHALHMRDFPSFSTSPLPASVRSSHSFFADCTNAIAHPLSPRLPTSASPSLVRRPPLLQPPAQMKECVLNDTRATTLAIQFDASIDKFVCGSSIERFSGHTGVCRVLGSKKYPVTPHSLQVGDLLRIGSVGLVVCELNRTADDSTQETLQDDEVAFLKAHYLSLPLQQTFHADTLETRHSEHPTNHKPTMRRGHETADECESEEDLCVTQSDACAMVTNSDSRAETSLGASGVPRGKAFCYICYDDDDDEAETNPLVAPCDCKGDTKFVHLHCLQRWNSNVDSHDSSTGSAQAANQRVCAVTNTDGLDVCTICKATYRTSVALDSGRVVSLLAQKLAPPYVTFAVVTQHETRNRQTALTNTRFQLSFANMPRNQQYLTIGRSTNNNMTLRYRTVSQLHAKIKHQDNNFLLYDALSSNGTMLFLSRPLELEWNKTVHVKIGRTILTLKSKKRWRWAGGTGHASDSDPHAHADVDAAAAATSLVARTSSSDDSVQPLELLASTPTNRTSTSPLPYAPARLTTTSHTRALERSATAPLNRFDSTTNNSAWRVRDPSVELAAASPFAAVRDARTNAAPPLSYAARRNLLDMHDDNAPAAAASGVANAMDAPPALLQRDNVAIALPPAAALELNDDMDDDDDDDALFYDMAETFGRLDVRRREADECELASAAAHGDRDSNNSPIVVGTLAGGRRRGHDRDD